MKKKFNLAAWSMSHKNIVYFFVVLLMITGTFAYCKLGRMEDPDYTIRQMVITTNWPGATAEQVEYQVTDKIEKQLQDLDGLDNLQSYSSPGQSTITVELKDTIKKADIQKRWEDARNLVNASVPSLPSGIESPVIDDHFDAVYGMVYALTAEPGFSPREMKDQAEKIRQYILTLPQTKKVELLGTQTECIYLDINGQKMMRMGITADDLEQVFQTGNTVVDKGMASLSSNNMPVQMKDTFKTPQEIGRVPLIKNGRSFHLADFSIIHRSYVEAGDPKFFYQGKPAIGIAVSMTSGENIIEYGNDLDKLMHSVEKWLPAGMEIHQTINQAKTVDDAVFDFVRSLIEALVIIFAVSLISLGRRAGVVVALCIPFVLAVVFSVMYMLHIDLQRVSLGALIIGLGLLVDDAMIVVEMIIVKLDEGWEKKDAVIHAFEVTAIPMLTGTLITCAGFIPVAFATGSSSEFCSSIFYVIAIALLVSWIVAGAVTPLLGYHFIERSEMRKEGKFAGWTKQFYQIYEKVLLIAVKHSKKVLWSVFAVFLLSCFLLTQVRQESFPESTRPELIVRLEFPENRSLLYTEQQTAKFADALSMMADVKSYTYTTGMGAPRFVLSFDPAQTKPGLAEFIIVAKDLGARKKLENSLREKLMKEFPEANVHLKVLVTGSSSEYPVMLCVKGPNLTKVRELSNQVATVMREHPNVQNVIQTSGKQIMGIHLDVDEEKAKQMGISSQSLGQDIRRKVEGKTISFYQNKEDTLPIILRFKEGDEDVLSSMGQLPVQLANGKKVPLDQVASISLQNESASIFRKNRLPAIQVCSEVKGDRTGEDVTQEVYDQLKTVREHLPEGYSIELDGALKDSNSNNASFLKPVPIMVLIILILLMFQLQNVVKTVLTLLTAPLGMIGVAPGLLITGKPFGFVVLMGILALFGIIIRNAIILIDQIEKHRQNGESVLEALVHASMGRLRPIMLTAMAAVLAMIPLAFNVFWGPMAVAMGAGLLVATVLTLLVLPVMYASCYLDDSQKK